MIRNLLEFLTRMLLRLAFVTIVVGVAIFVTAVAWRYMIAQEAGPILGLVPYQVTEGLIATIAGVTRVVTAGIGACLVVLTWMFVYGVLKDSID